MAQPVATVPFRARTAYTGLSAVAVGAAVAILVLLAEFSGLLGGWVLLGLGVVAALAVPVSREASRRVLLIGCVILGWGPMMWWFPIRIPGLTHAGMAVAVLLGVLAGLVVAGRLTARSMVPTFRLTDLTVLAAGAFAAWMAWPLLTIRDGEMALRTMLIGWDYAAHFNMAEMVRRIGSLVGMASPGPLGQWDHTNYPKGFHAAVATVMETTVGPGISTPSAELLGFVHATAVLSIAAVTIVAAGVASIPRTRRRPLLATLLVGLVVLALTLGPGGGILLQSGFPNFLLATTQLACIPLIVSTLARVGWTAPLLGLSGCLVGIAHNWALLLVVAVAALLPAILPFRRRRWPSTARAWMGVGGIVFATAAATIAAWWTLSSGKAGHALTSVLVIDGVFLGGSRIEILLPPFLAIGVCAAVGWLTLFGRQPRAVDGEAARIAGGMLLPITGLVLLGYVAAVQLSANGALGYYFYKLGTAIQLASVVVIAGTIPVFSRVARASGWRRTSFTGVALGLVVLFATSSGAANPTSEAFSLRRPPGLDARDAWQKVQATGSSDSAPPIRDLLHGADAVSGDTPHFWISPELDRSNAPRLGNQWLFALTGQWSVASYAVIADMWGDAVPLNERPRDTEEAIAMILEESPDAIVVVSPEVFDRLSNEPEFAGHIVPW